MARLPALAVALLALAAAPCLAQVETRNVTFVSAGRSGNLTMHGTLLLPTDADAVGPAVVLVGGSGPTDRWSTDGVLRPLWDIAQHVARGGRPVLAYDKRSCTGATHALCAQRTVCGAPGAPADSCLNVSQLVMQDFVDDAANAIEFLLREVEPLNVTGAVPIGHSQGALVATRAASSYEWRSGAIAGVMMLAGTGVRFDALLEDQARVQEPVIEGIERQVEAEPPSARRNATLETVRSELDDIRCAIRAAVPQFELVLNGTLPVDVPHEGVCPFAGGGACADGCVCATGHNTSDECLARCRTVASAGACLVPLFAESLLNLTGEAARLLSVRALHRKGISAFAVNSPEDLKVPPVVYHPLHFMLDAVDELGTLFLHKEVANLTHLLTDKNNATSTEVAPAVLKLVGSYLDVAESLDDDNSGDGGFPFPDPDPNPFPFPDDDDDDGIDYDDDDDDSDGSLSTWGIIGCVVIFIVIAGGGTYCRMEQRKAAERRIAERIVTQMNAQGTTSAVSHGEGQSQTPYRAL